MVTDRDKIVNWIVHDSFLRRVGKVFLRFYVVREIFIFDALIGYGDSPILDVGCGEGNLLLMRFGSVIGVDVSAFPLFAAKEKYSHVVCASATHLPFRESTFGFLNTTDFIGHVAMSEKAQFFSEMHRVLKPNAYSCHVVETDSNDRTYRFLKKFPRRYSRAMIDIGGHFGLETSENTIKRFRETFQIVEVEKIYSWILETEQVYTLLRFCHESHTAIQASKVCGKLIGSVFKRLVINATLSFLSYLQSLYVPLDKINGLMVIAKKEV